MTQDTLQALQQEWLQVKQQLDALQTAAEAEDADADQWQASLQMRLDELEFEIALRERGSGPCSLICGMLPKSWSMCYESLEANFGQGDSDDQEA